MELEAKRTKDIGNRNGTYLASEKIRVLVDDQGGMTPELSYRRANGYLNTHWVPLFRGNSGKPYSKGAHGAFWKSRLLYELAGNFPCLPSFGAGCTAYGITFEPHSATANAAWKFEGSGVLPGRAAYSISSLSREKPRDLSYRKYDIVLADQPVHYAVVIVKNSGKTGYRINAAWHNTLGSPFLEKDCLIDISAQRYATVPPPNEFDATGHLAVGVEFDDLEKVPLRDGKFINARVVPGMIGYTDLIRIAVTLILARIEWTH